MLNEMEEKFLAKRKKLVKYWNIVGVILILMISFLAIMLYFKSPLLLNPFELNKRMIRKTIKSSTIILLATLLPITNGIIVFLLFTIILFGFVFISHEKKYIKILEELEK